MQLTRTLTHIRLYEVNDAKVAALDALATEYMALCQQYVTAFCTEAEPNGYADLCFPSPLSQRWQRVAIQQAAGIARSWRSNHQRAQEDFADILASWLEEAHKPEETPPKWTLWRTPTLKKTVIQANANVALLQPSQDTSFAYWLRVSTLEARQTIFLLSNSRPIMSAVWRANGWTATCHSCANRTAGGLPSPMRRRFHFGPYLMRRWSGWM
jgi:hypothetical protein